MTGQPNITKYYEAYEKELANANTRNKTAVFDAMGVLRISTLTVAFDGKGDSGQIENVVAYIDGTSQRVPEATVQFHQVSFTDLETTASDFSLYEAIKCLCFDYLAVTHGGWENNEGGSGEFIFRLAEREIELDFDARFTDSSNFSHTF